MQRFPVDRVEERVSNQRRKSPASIAAEPGCRVENDELPDEVEGQRVEVRGKIEIQSLNFLENVMLSHPTEREIADQEMI